MSDTVVCENPRCRQDTGHVKGEWWAGNVTCHACGWVMYWNGNEVNRARSPKKGEGNEPSE